jgi:hypothetical protein
MLPEDHHLTDSADEVLDKAEAFPRHGRLAVPIPSDDDVPVLTDIVPESELAMMAVALPYAESEGMPQLPAGQPPEAADTKAPEFPEQPGAFEEPETVSEAPETAEPEIPERRDAVGLDDLDFELPAAPLPGAEESPPEPQALGAAPSASEPEPEPEPVPEPEPMAAEVPSPAPPDTEPLPLLTEQIVAARVADALQGQRQVVTLLLEEWLNFDLPTLIKQEFENASQRIVRRSLQEIHTLLDVQDTPDKQ